MKISLVLTPSFEKWSQFMTTRQGTNRGLDRIVGVEITKIDGKIYTVRGRCIMLDSDLAALYGVETGNLNKAVNRNRGRFPNDFMFQLTSLEHENLRFQIGISSWGGRRYMPRAFTEHGVAMLSSVLNSERAVRVNIEIVRAFVRLRQILVVNKELADKIEKMGKRLDVQNVTLGEHEEAIQEVFEEVQRLMGPSEGPSRKIGF